MSPPKRAVHVGLLAALRTTGQAVGDGKPPKPLPPDEKPYGILEVATGGSRWGTLSAPEGSATWPWRVRAVGRSADQVLHLLDAFDAVILGRDPAGNYSTPIVVDDPGWVVGQRWYEADGGVDSESDVFNASAIYSLSVVPA